MADIFDVVADPTRRDLLHALLDAYVVPDETDEGRSAGELSVGELVEKLGLSQPTVSKHLKVLRDHELVSVREEGQHRYYKLDSSPLEDIEDWLIPFLSADYNSADFDGADYAAGPSPVYAAWAGADVGESIGRAAAAGSHQVREVLHGASETVNKVLPKSITKLWLDGKE
jgi:ArsR family transcriptional regulator, arsenate/arsenite/antimonite-responsive transcriptional repressor